MNTFEYKGYLGSCELDADKVTLVGKLLFIQDVIAYSGESVADLKKSFEDAVDEYLEVCKMFGDKPNIPCKGTFNVRISPEMHMKAVLLAHSRNQTLNDFVKMAIASECTAIEDSASKPEATTTAIKSGNRWTPRPSLQLVKVDKLKIDQDSNYNLDIEANGDCDAIERLVA